ncbi:MAG: hypothetical protein V7676_16970 [Parasphingorhabdus sp.]|jgi:hypothetical protein|uniref:hypothetical protein n=1 Tax=Parasphingorhabdus sp. TaxID=2709688 RepID=UPI003002560D
MRTRTKLEMASLVKHGFGRRRIFKRIAVSGMLPILIFVSLGVAHAASDPEPPDRLVSLIVYGSEPCPAGKDGEIVVCGREPESERYRIPKELREVKYRPAEQSWASRVHTLDDASRSARPNSCSVVGYGGQTGCYAHALEQWRAEQR